MQITRHATARSFLARTRPLLEGNEAVNSLLLGLAERHARSEVNDPEDTLFLEISASGEPIFAILRAASPKVVIYGHPEHWRAVAPAVLPATRKYFPHLEGFNGLNEQVRGVVEAHGIAYKIKFSQGLFRLDQVTFPPHPPGHARVAEPADLELLTEWMVRFVVEAMHKTPDRSDLRDRLTGLRGDERMWVWDDGGIVAMAMPNRPTRHGISISYVYTPPERRRKGYATCLTAALSEAMLRAGYHFTALFTDLANPTSNSIYRKIGYHKIAEFSDLELL
ncbi:MAG: GNAT family N-acetyltransferase [Bacteroidota bacterium]